MASAGYDEKRRAFILSFRPLGKPDRRRPAGQPDTRRTVRVHEDKLRAPTHEARKDLADALATECDQLCRLLETTPLVSDIERALILGAITPAQEVALRRGLPVPPAHRERGAGPLTLQAAAEMHPSTMREQPAGRRKYLDYLTRFSEHSGITLVRDVTLPAVQAYVGWMVAQGYAWDTRRNRLLYLRRACRMGATQGLPDVLGDLVLDKPGRRAPPQAWTLDELARGALALGDDQRGLVALGLGGFLGLRPSEIFRVRVGDLRADGMLAIGLAETAEAKNEPSRRLLPVPATLARWMRQLAGDRATGEPLVYALGGRIAADPEKRERPRRCFDQTTFSQWAGPLLERATGRDLPVKCLRKSFASWATSARLDHQHVEAFLGHETDLVAQITGRHYLTDLHEHIAGLLRPTAKEIERHLVAALKRAEGKGRARKAAAG